MKIVVCLLCFFFLKNVEAVAGVGDFNIGSIIDAAKFVVEQAEKTIPYIIELEEYLHTFHQVDLVVTSNQGIEVGSGKSLVLVKSYANDINGETNDVCASIHPPSFISHAPGSTPAHYHYYGRNMGIVNVYQVVPSPEVKYIHVYTEISDQGSGLADLVEAVIDDPVDSFVKFFEHIMEKGGKEALKETNAFMNDQLKSFAGKDPIGFMKFIKSISKEADKWDGMGKKITGSINSATKGINKLGDTFVNKFDKMINFFKQGGSNAVNNVVGGGGGVAEDISKTVGGWFDDDDYDYVRSEDEVIEDYIQFFADFFGLDLNQQGLFDQDTVIFTVGVFPDLNDHTNELADCSLSSTQIVKIFCGDIGSANEEFGTHSETIQGIGIYGSYVFDHLLIPGKTKAEYGLAISPDFGVGVNVAKIDIHKAPSVTEQYLTDMMTYDSGISDEEVPPPEGLGDVEILEFGDNVLSNYVNGEILPEEFDFFYGRFQIMDVVDIPESKYLILGGKRKEGDADISFDEATDFCENVGKQLGQRGFKAKITSQEENDAVRTACGGERCWIGLTRKSGSMYTWYYDDTTVNSLNNPYSNWNDNWKSDQSDWSRKVAFFYPNGMWRPIRDTSRWPAVACSIRKSGHCSENHQQSVSALPYCFDVTEVFFEKNFIYFYVHSEVGVTAFEANVFCEANDMELASIHSQEENDLLQARTESYSYNWIGLNDVGLEGSYFWSDGSRVDFLNWNTGRPYANASPVNVQVYTGYEDQNTGEYETVQKSVIDNSRDCVYMKNGKWEDTQCDNGYKNFFCKTGAKFYDSDPTDN